MMELIIYIGAYLIGSLSLANMLGKAKGKSEEGWRVLLTPPGWLGALKGWLAVSLSHFLAPGDAMDKVVAGFLCLVAEEFPAFNRFKGGERGLGTLVGVFGALLFWMFSRGF